MNSAGDQPPSAPLPDQKLAEAAAWLREAQRVVVFTGAGVSAESGIPTFRDPGGLWSRFEPERFATASGLLDVAAREPVRLIDFFIAVARPIIEAQPNAAHRAIAQLQHCRPTCVITQNIDALHQRAGSTTVHEVHGSLFRWVSLDRTAERHTTPEELGQWLAKLEAMRSEQPTVEQLIAAFEPLVRPTGQQLFRPSVVLFEEMLAEPDWTLAQRAARQCDLLLVVGTSAAVYPAATLIDDARRAGARIVSVDPHQPLGALWLPGEAGRLLPQLVREAFPQHPAA